MAKRRDEQTPEDRTRELYAMMQAQQEQMNLEQMRYIQSMMQQNQAIMQKNQASLGPLGGEGKGGGWRKGWFPPHGGIPSPGPYRPPMPPNKPPVYQPNPFAIPQRRSEAAMAYQQAAQDTWRQMQASRVRKNKPTMPSPAMPSPMPSPERKNPGFLMPEAGPLPQRPRNLQPTPSPQAAPLQTRFQQINSNESFGLPKSNPSIKNMEENKMSKAKPTPRPSLSQFTPRFERPKKGPY